MNMLALYIIIPIMVLAIAVAVVPVLVGSFRHNKAMQDGRLESVDSANEEADFWHRMLGHRSGRPLVKTPEMIADGEVTRVVAEPEDRVVVDGDSAWSAPR
jgi:hypothetical protein